jgi:hypothetical protein
MGCAAANSAARLAGGVAWLGWDTRGGLTAYLAANFVPQRISTHAIETAWGAYATVSDAVSYAYTDSGHQFWVVNFPTANATWVYDATAQLWHERGWWNGASVDRHRANCHGFVFGMHLVGDWQSGEIYSMALGTYSDAGTPIHRLRTAPHVSDENKMIQYSRFTLAMETGDGSSPAVTLECSNDGGHTFGALHSATAGAAGAYTARVIWRRLGRARDRVFRVQMQDASKVAWVDAYLGDVEGTE